MGLCRRAMACLNRKKGKALLLFLIFLLVSVLLLQCCSILAGTGQAAKDLRSNIGAAFYIRPYAEMKFSNGKMEEVETPTISEQDIDNVLAAAGGEVKTYNTEHYGYAKSSQLHFIPGVGDNAKSNMGRVTAVRDSEMTDKFLNGTYVLQEGRHIQPEDNHRILISQQLACENKLKVGDKITLTHAELDQEDGIYVDKILNKTAFAEVQIEGIYTIAGDEDDVSRPTAGKTVNHIIADGHLLSELQEQPDGIYDGEISFFIADPLHLDDMLVKVKGVASVDWDNHILRENDFQYEQIADQLGNLQDISMALIVITLVSSVLILMLILTMRIRNRMHEAGVMLALGKPKSEILGQFVLETAVLLLAGFVVAVVLSYVSSGILNHALFDSILDQTPTGILQADTVIHNYLQPDIIRSLTLCAGELGAVVLAVIVSSSTILAMKPNEVLHKMN